MRDDGETSGKMEPLIPEEASKHRAELNELAALLLTRSAELAESVSNAQRDHLRDETRRASALASYAIEGHILDEALPSDRMALEAHISAQEWLQAGGLAGRPLAECSLREIHARLCSGLPPEHLRLIAPDGSEGHMSPGTLRDSFVRVGTHIPPSPGAVPRLLTHLDRMLGFQGRIGKVLYTAAAHHRLVWIHPFPDLNGRVSRLAAEEMLRLYAGNDGLWSLSSGFARRVEDYRAHLRAADEPRQGGADGRGNLSEARLAEFCRFFMTICIQEVDHAKTLLAPTSNDP